MEADEYFSTYDALHKEDGHSVGRLPLNVKETCGINKILWSSFDFMTGPELRFVWELTPSHSISPVNLSTEEGSVNDAESLDSSLSIQSAQYEDIDDPLQADLTTLDMMDSMLLSDSAYHFFTSSPIGNRDSGPFLEDYMSESRSTTTLTNTTVGMEDSRVWQPQFGSPDVDQRLQADVARDRGSSSNTTQISPSPRGILSGTPIEGMDMSKILARQEDEAIENREIGVDTEESNDDGVLEEVQKKLENLDSGLTTSCVDSGIAGTISMHSDLSAQCLSPDNCQPAASNPEVPIMLQQSSSSSSSGDDILSLIDISLDSSDDPITDEVFVSKFVLAEQICSTQLSSNPLMHKLTVVPSRRLLVSSYIFSSESNGRPTLHALSFLMNSQRSDWYMPKQSFFESYLMDVVPRLKSVLYLEDWDDVIVRATSELTSLMELLGAIDRFPLVSPTRPLMIKNTLLCGRRCGDDPILSRAISGVLQSQGQCVIVGSNHTYVSKLLNTLSLFVPEQLRWCSVRSFRHKYNPYLRLQAVRRAEVPRVIQLGVWSAWPICVIDVDKATVCMSAPYNRHRIVRRKAEEERIRSMLEQHEDLNGKSIKLRLSSCRTLDCVRQFVRQIDYLPLEESCRIGFVNQFLLYIENMAIAFIQYTKDASKPSATEKSTPMKSSSFSLSECRKALDLQSDSWFHAVLANAELICPDIADFVCA